MKRMLLVVTALLVLLPVAGVVAFRAWFNETEIKARLADTVRRSTGRELTVAGPVGLAWSLRPTLRLSDVRVANPPGFSRPDLLRVGSIEAQVALRPLLSRRVEVLGITVQQPDLLLERDAAGQPNWVMSHSPAAPAAGTAPSVPGSRTNVAIHAIRLSDGRVGWLDKGRLTEVAVPALTLSAAGPAEPAGVQGSLVVAGAQLAVSGTTGPLGTATTAPLDLRVQGSGIDLAVKGALAEGVEAAGTVADLSALSPLAGLALPPLRNVEASARLGAAGLSRFSLRAGPGELGALAPGMSLERLEVTAPAPDQPVSVVAEASSRGQPVSVTGSIGSLAALLGAGPVPVQAAVAAAGARLTGQGSVDWRGNGLDLVVSAQVPQLDTLGAAFGAALPPWRSVSLDARLATDPAGGLSTRALMVLMPQGEVSGNLTVGWSPRPFVRGSLASARLDMDVPVAGLPPPSAPGPAASPATPDPAVPGHPGPGSERVLSDAPLPFAALRRADADLHVTVAEAVWRGRSYQAVEGRVRLQDGRLQLDPLQAMAAGSQIAAQATLDASAEPPSVSLAVRAPALAAGALLGAPAGTTGMIDLDVALRGSGHSVRAIAATLDGYAGAAMVEGEVENQWLVSLLGDALRHANLPIDAGGRSKVRCFAVRADAARGQAVLRTLLLDATRLRLEGEGGANLAEETLDLRLRPLVRLGGTGVGVSVRIGGTFRAPQAVMDAGAGQPGRVGIVIGALTPPGDDGCAAALLSARNGRAGPAPAAAETKPLKPADVLRGLFR